MNIEILKAYFSNIDSRLYKHVSGKPKEFIEVFREGNFLSEEAFMTALCGNEHSEEYYFQWKSRTLKILQAFAIVSDEKGGSTTKKKFDNCQKKFLLAQKFFTQGQRVEGLRLAKQAYQLATEYSFPHLASELASILHHDHVYYHKNRRLASYYEQQTNKYLDYYISEKKAEQYLYKVFQLDNSEISEELLKITIQKISNLQGESIKYKFYEATAHIIYATFIGKYEYLIRSCDEVLQFFKTRKGAHPAYYLYFFRARGTAQIAIKKYKEAKVSFDQAEKYTKRSPHNNYIIQFYKMLNELHAGNYQTAYELYQKNKRCKIEPIRQQFAIIEAYLCFLIHTGYLQINKTFRIGKYLNDTFKAQQDKKGDNVNILIAELLVYLARDWGKFIDRIEAIKNYSYRHLKGEDTKRAKSFLKVLCLIAHPKVNFHPIALQRKATRHIEILKSHQVRMGENFAIEIIPFDHLLDMILERVMRRVA